MKKAPLLRRAALKINAEDQTDRKIRAEEKSCHCSFEIFMHFHEYQNFEYFET
jgi:hypothetical protein